MHTTARVLTPSVADADVLGTKTVTDGWRTSLEQHVRDVVEEAGTDVEVGDRLASSLEDGRVVVVPA